MLGETLALGERGGLDWEQMLDIVSSGPAGSPVINIKLDGLKKKANASGVYRVSNGQRLRPGYQCGKRSQFADANARIGKNLLVSDDRKRRGRSGFLFRTALF